MRHPSRPQGQEWSPETCEIMAIWYVMDDEGRKILENIITDALEMSQEGYTEAEVQHYMERNYGAALRDSAKRPCRR